jgi:hypothetical protein
LRSSRRRVSRTGAGAPRRVSACHSSAADTCCRLLRLARLGHVAGTSGKGRCRRCKRRQHERRPRRRRRPPVGGQLGRR